VSRFRPSSNPHTLAVFPSSFLPCDAQPCQHEIPGSDHRCGTENDITPDDLPLFRVFETEQATTSSSFMDEVSHAHHGGHSVLHLTNSHATCHVALDNDHQPTSLFSSVDQRVKHIYQLNEQFSNATRTAAESPLLRWVHETDNSNITFAERLEKSKWQESRVQKL